MRAVFLLLLSAMILGLGGGYAWSKWSKPSAAEQINAHASIPAAKPGQTAHEVEQSAYYADCDAVRNAGKAPIYPGQPGYRQELDPADTGVACPPLS